ncbi:outer membrane beta-barrel protein [Pontibacter flavimaris]|uniref:PorT family protein n=1 Tax=Pontibacter flavimaris TaxID=1797110 RepID=A0A1Q5PCC9_9BACT|nr:outer membrane beta-barrel protein [Pontibacter flavimaris]OKL39853.1 hypothetical protein A3841_15865 [Pontibacter flavimaris]
MKQLYITLTFLFICSLSFAQKSFQPGYIVQHGDTVRGLVDYRGAMRSSVVTTFKQQESAAEQTFTPHDITAYGFDSGQKHFEAFDIPVTAGADTTKERVFLDVLVKGRASVYYYRDSFHKDRYFLKKEAQPLIELIYEEIKLKDLNSGKLYKAEKRDYTNTIAVAFADCEKIRASRYKDLMFTASALADITEAYNQCVGDGAPTQKAGRKKSKLTFAPALTYTSSTFTLKGDEHPVSQGKYKNESVGLGGGITANVTIPRLNEKLSLQADLLYMPFRQTASFNHRNNLGFNYAYDVVFDVDYLKVPVQLMYTYPNGRIRPYVSAGLVNNMAVQVTQQATRTDYYDPDEPRVREQEAFGEGGFRKRTLGITAGAGMSIPFGGKALLLSVRYEANENSSAIHSVSAKARHVYVMLGYRL